MIMRNNKIFKTLVWLFVLMIVFNFHFQYISDFNVSEVKASNNNIVDNPLLESSCGIDIVLIIDSSSSMYGSPLQQEKEAFKAFINNLLPDTPANFAIVDFNTEANTIHAFSNNISSLESAIDSISTTPNVGHPDHVSDDTIYYTNWKEALENAYGLFPGRPEKPNLIIFASDGDPTRPSDYFDNVHNKVLTPLSSAIIQANAIKENGIRIVSFGIGNSVREDNLKKISGYKADDVIMSGFNDFSSRLSVLANELCGGSVVIKKYLDNVLSDGWSFEASSNSVNINNSIAVTSDGGYAVFEISELDVQPAIVDITETIQLGSVLDEAFCDNGQNGTLSGTTISGIVVRANSSVICSFYNTTVQDPCVYKVGGYKYELEDNIQNPLPEWEIELYSSTNDFISATTSDENGYYYFENLCEGSEYLIKEKQQINWEQVSPLEPDYHAISIVQGQEKNYDFINTYNKPIQKFGSISGYKYKDLDGSSSTEEYLENPLSGWLISLFKADDLENPLATTTTENSNGAFVFNNLDDGVYQLKESVRDGWTQLIGPLEDIIIENGGDSDNIFFVNYQEPCGDGICDEDENCENCPEDCGECQNENIMGCTDENASNYNSNATTDDGSCRYPSSGGGFASILLTTPTGQQEEPEVSEELNVPEEPEEVVVLGEEGKPILSLEKIIESDFVNPDEKNIKYKILIKNTGSLTAFNVIVRDELQEGLSYADIEEMAREWTIGDLDPDESRGISYYVDVDPDIEAGYLKNIAIVKAENHEEISTSAELEVLPVVVLAETGFKINEFFLLLGALISVAFTARKIRKKAL